MREGENEAFWALPAADLSASLGTAASGLAEEEAERRLREVGGNVLVQHRRTDLPALIFGQLASPIVVILLAATVLAFFLGDASDAAIVLGIVAA